MKLENPMIQLSNSHTISSRPKMPHKNRNLAVFDFDWSLIDIDSDRFSVSDLHPGFHDRMDELRPMMQWTDMMHHLYGELHSNGIRPDHIKHTLSKLPLAPAMAETLRFLKEEANADIYILSDANTVFINELLEAKKVRHYVTDVISNPAYFDEAGRLHIQRRIKKNDLPHGCDIGICAENICKGKEMNLLLSQQQYERVIYVGDGRNDYCPSTKLSPKDFVMCRKNRALEKLLKQKFAEPDQDGFYSKIEEAHPAVQAQVVYWDEAHDLLRELRTVLMQ
jgi:pyridoxal phosphate phosphatase PHOSPHO2